MTSYSLNPETKSIIHDKTGEGFSPSCFEDLRLYCAYISGKKHGKEKVQEILRDVFKGEKVMVKLTEAAQRHGI